MLEEKQCASQCCRGLCEKFEIAILGLEKWELLNFQKSPI